MKIEKSESEYDESEEERKSLDSSSERELKPMFKDTDRVKHE